MNDRTGEIRQMTPETAEELNRLSREANRLERDGLWMPLSDSDVNEVQGMNRAQRRAWARAKRKGGKR